MFGYFNLRFFRLDKKLFALFFLIRKEVIFSSRIKHIRYKWNPCIGIQHVTEIYLGDSDSSPRFAQSCVIWLAYTCKTINFNCLD